MKFVVYRVHTYNSFLIKILAADIVSAHNLTSFEYPAQALATITSDSELFDKLDSEIEHSGLFESAQISGFVEEVIFSWYLELKDSDAAPNIYQSVRTLLSKVSLYVSSRFVANRFFLFFHEILCSLNRYSILSINPCLSAIKP